MAIDREKLREIWRPTEGIREKLKFLYNCDVCGPRTEIVETTLETMEKTRRTALRWVTLHQRMWGHKVEIIESPINIG